MSFHEDVLAEVGIGCGLPESFRVRNGHAGYILAHILLNLYFIVL